jgi:hypothetical protein
MKVVVIEEILCNPGYRGTQREGHGEQQDTGHCGLVLFFHPAHKVLEAAFIVREKEVDDEEHPGKGERTDNDDIERDAKSAHTSSNPLVVLTEGYEIGRITVWNKAWHMGKERAADHRTPEGRLQREFVLVTKNEQA